MNRCSNIGNADVDVSDGCRTGDVGVKGEVGVVIIDEAEVVRRERGCCASKSAVDIEFIVDIDARLSNRSVQLLPLSDLGFRCVAWKSSWGGSEPKT